MELIEKLILLTVLTSDGRAYFFEMRPFTHMNSEESYMICFSHIPKTGGTTFRNILIHNFSWQHVDIPRNKKDFFQPSDFPINTLLKKHIKSMSGNRLRYSDEFKKFFPEFKFVSFIRDPISRIISLFFQLQRLENLKLNFNDWVLKNKSLQELNNLQTQFIAGSKDFRRAKEIIRDNFFFVGSTNNFDRSLLLLKKILKNEFDIRYVKKNVSNRNKNEILNDRKNHLALDLIKEKNQLDLQLFNYVNDTLLKNYQKKFGTISEDDVSQFKELNRNFNPKIFNKKIFLIVKYSFFENIFRLL